VFKSESLEPWAAGGQASVELALIDLPALADAFSGFLRTQDFLLLQGDLGAGKTTFVALLARALGTQQQVASPTFSLLNVIDIAVPAVHSISRICHMDLYRVRRSEELLHLGLELEFNSSALAIIEWCENVDGMGWKHFFETTRCRKPTRILTLSIENIQEASKRRYSFGWLSFSEFVDA